MRFPLALGFLACCLGQFGCSSSEVPLYPVTGSILIDGKPAVGALLMFIPNDAGNAATTLVGNATADASGQFTAYMMAKPGLKPGSYTVTVRWPDPTVKITDAQKMMGVSPYDAPDVLKGKYATKEQSPLKVEILAQDNQLAPFNLVK